MNGELGILGPDVAPFQKASADDNLEVYGWEAWLIGTLTLECQFTFWDDGVV